MLVAIAIAFQLSLQEGGVARIIGGQPTTGTPCWSPLPLCVGEVCAGILFRWADTHEGGNSVWGSVCLHCSTSGGSVGPTLFFGVFFGRLEKLYLLALMPRVFFGFVFGCLGR